MNGELPKEATDERDLGVMVTRSFKSSSNMAAAKSKRVLGGIHKTITSRDSAAITQFYKPW